MRHINLYQDEFRPPAVALPAGLILRLCGLFLLGLLLVHGWQQWRLSVLRTETDTVKAQARQMDSRAQTVRTAAKPADPRVLSEAEAWERRLAALHKAQQALEEGAAGREAGFSGPFRALAQATVSGAWLLRVDMAGARREMSLHGRALTGEDAARLVASLKRQPQFTGLRFAALELETPKDASREHAGSKQAGAPVPPPLEFDLRATLPLAAPPLANALTLPAPLPAALANLPISLGAPR